jgi:hypothetical protein
MFPFYPDALTWFLHQLSLTQAPDYGSFEDIFFFSMFRVDVFAP